MLSVQTESCRGRLQRSESAPEWGQCTAPVRMLARLQCCGSRRENTGDLGRARVQEATGWRPRERDQGTSNEGWN